MEKKKRKNGKLYQVTDKQGNVILTGTCGDVQLELNVNKNMIYHHSITGRPIKDKFYVTEYYEGEPVYIPKEPILRKDEPKEEKKLSEYEADYLYLKHHLELYGNTVFPTNPAKLLKDLEKKDDIKAVITEHSRCGLGWCYVIEAKNFKEIHRRYLKRKMRESENVLAIY